MDKYLLNSEKNRINFIQDKINLLLGNDLNIINKKFLSIIRNNKDGCLDDILNYFFVLLNNDMSLLFDDNITLGMQYGIKNKYFSFLAYGGKRNILFDNVNINTKFSLDSISKYITALIVMIDIKYGEYDFKTKISDYDKEFFLDSTFSSILKFTSAVRTNGRIDGLDTHDTIEKLKECKQDLLLKQKYKNFYEYNDIGYMVLRQAIKNFLVKLDELIGFIDNENITYITNYGDNITGGKKTCEHLTPDTKGIGIIFPGHTGLYANIEGLINIFYKSLAEDHIINIDDRYNLFSQPYKCPIVYEKNGMQKIGKNGSYQYMAKVAGIYRKPLGIFDKNYDKMASCDMSNNTSNRAVASAGTCGSWGIYDNLSIDNMFGSYVGGIVTNPYSYVDINLFPDKNCLIPNTNLKIDSKGTIIGYQGKLNKYKETITEYGIILEMLCEYIKLSDKNILDINTKKYIKKID